MKKRMHVWIRGIVKGVAFRHETKIVADRLGLNGWIRNNEGGVEAVFEGNHDKINNILEFCQKGPTTAKVEEVETKEETFTGEFKEFKILHF